MGKMRFLSQFNFSLFHSEHFSGVSVAEAPVVNALFHVFHATVGLCLLAKTYARDPGGLRKMFLCMFGWF